MRILVIEDDDAVRAALRRALMLAGYEVLLAGDGEDGLLQVETSVPDALVFDLGLPRVDGMDVCRQLRSTGSRVPILMLTARDAIEDRVAVPRRAPMTTSSSRMTSASSRPGCERSSGGTSTGPTAARCGSATSSSTPTLMGPRSMAGPSS